MERLRRLVVLLLLLALTEYTLSEEILNTGEFAKEKIFQDKNHPHNIPEDEISKRAIENAITTFSRLKTKFLALASGTPSRKFGRLGKPGPAGPSAAKVDIVFVMDKSGSIGSSNFQLAKTFVETLIEYFPIFPAKTRVAIVTYATNVKLEFNFKKHINRECLRKGIQRIRYTGGSTATGTALQYVRNTLIFNIDTGARNGALKIVFVLTDGQSNKGVSPGIPAGLLKSSGIVTFALGVTKNVRQSELEAIASQPPKDHVFHVSDYATLNQVTQAIQGDLSKQCYHDHTVYDECGRRCKCEYGKKVKCCRLRKEVTDMSYAERVRYINTVKTASTHSSYKPRYDTLLTLHKNIFFTGIHGRDFFLPWHRWFILQYENLLQEIDCRVTVPYWDWSLVGGSPFSSTVWNTGPEGFGGNGVPGGSCVNSGPFRQALWSLPVSAGGGCLTRDFFGTAPDSIAVANLITSNSNPSDFLNFEDLLRVQFHNLVHCIISGTMCTLDSATAPEFFLHHGFVDKIWWDWQKQSNAHKFNTYFMTQLGLMTSTPYPSRDFLDLNDQPDCVCAEYVNPQNEAFGRIKALSISERQKIARLPLPALSAEASKLFRTTSRELEKVSKLRAKIQPVKVVPKNSLRGTDAVLGIKLGETVAIGRVGVKAHAGTLDEERRDYEEDNFYSQTKS